MVGPAPGPLRARGAPQDLAPIEVNQSQRAAERWQTAAERSASPAAASAAGSDGSADGFDATNSRTQSSVRFAPGGAAGEAAAAFDAFVRRLVGGISCAS